MKTDRIIAMEVALEEIFADLETPLFIRRMLVMYDLEYYLKRRDTA